MVLNRTGELAAARSPASHTKRYKTGSIISSDIQLDSNNTQPNVYP